jgi:hypothetical protein
VAMPAMPMPMNMHMDMNRMPNGSSINVIILQNVTLYIETILNITSPNAILP